MPASMPQGPRLRAAPALAAYAQTAQTQYDDLCALVRIPSVSFPNFDPAAVVASAEAVAKLLTQRGFNNARLATLPNVHPYVLAERHVSDARPTLLVYAHHDVQPAGDLSLWHTDPFVPTQKEGRLYGRGAADDKAGICVHTAAVAAYLAAEDDLPVNLKVVIEGEEEVGSAHLGAFIAAHAKDLSAQAMVLTDTANFDIGVPSITVSLRGLVVVDVEVRTTHHALHSGMWGGPVPDAAMALAKMLASLTDASGEITIPGIVAAYAGPTPAQQAGYDALPTDRATFARQAGLLPGVHLVGQHNPFEGIWQRPSLSINALQASSEADARNILVDRAWAKVGLRLSPSMAPEDAARALEEALQHAAPFGAHVRLKRETSNGGWHTETHHPAFAACARALTQGYGRPPVLAGCGGSIPFVQPMCQALADIPALLLGVEDPYTQAHAENESLHLADWGKATRSAIHLYAELAAVL